MNAAADPAALKELAVRSARELGAGDVRVVRAFDDPTSRQRMREAFARGDFATWGFDEARAVRSADPGALLEGARSVVCLAFPYATPPPNARGLRGRVSNYAWSRDYHGRVRDVLDEVARRMDAAAGAPVTAVACDTRPIAERAFAALAGLGWIGKHTNLISPKLGSFVFLGEIVPTLALEPDAPLRKSCGTCARCIDACPTRALRGDYTIDATLCISDLTQRTDAIPRELRPLIGEWIWGCDLCQAACPPTRLAGTAADPAAFGPANDSAAAPELVKLLRLRSGDFKRLYERTAMGWRGAAILRRNAAVALGNALDRSAVAPLARALHEDPHPMVRGHVAWALGRIASPSAISALRSRYEEEADPSVREEIRAALQPFLPTRSANR